MVECILCSILGMENYLYVGWVNEKKKSYFGEIIGNHFMHAVEVVMTEKVQIRYKEKILLVDIHAIIYVNSLHTFLLKPILINNTVK